MMVDQWSVVTTNITSIDRLKGDLLLNFDDKSKSHLPSAANEVFGGDYGFHWHWLNPRVKVTFPSTIRDEVLGYSIPALDGCIRCPNDCDIEMQDMRAFKKGVVETL